MLLLECDVVIEVEWFYMVGCHSTLCHMRQSGPSMKAHFVAHRIAFKINNDECVGAWTAKVLTMKNIH
jgi:hypothetical protein